MTQNADHRPAFGGKEGAGTDTRLGGQADALPGKSVRNGQLFGAL